MENSKVDFFVDVNDDFFESHYGFLNDFEICLEKENNLKVKEFLKFSKKQGDLFCDDNEIYFCSNNDDSVSFKLDKPSFVCIPQNKLVNFSFALKNVRGYFSVFDNQSLKNEFDNFDNLFIFNELEKKYKFNKKEAMFIPFDYWMCIGAVFGRLQRLWLCYDKDFSRLPTNVYMSFEDIFGVICPEYTLKYTGDSDELTTKVRTDFLRYFRDTFIWLNNHGISFSLTNFDNFSKEYYLMENVLKNDIVYKKIKNELIPIGVKINLKNNWLWEFTAKDRKNFRAVHIHPYDLFVKSHFKRNGYYHCFEQGYMAWNILFKNYWEKNDKFKELFSGQYFDIREMNYAFSSHTTFQFKKLKSEKIDDMLNAFTKEKTLELNCKKSFFKPAHINRIDKVNKFVWKWDLTSEFILDDVFAKDENGSYYKLDFSNQKPEIQLIKKMMEDINKINSDSVVCLNRQQIKTHMSCILHTEKNKYGLQQVIFGKYGRNYTFNNGFQGVKSKERLKFTINGKKVSEIDYSGLHLQMLYAIEGINYNKEDVYDVGDWYKKYNLSLETARKAVKKMMLIMINASSQTKMWYSFRKEWNEMNGWKKNRKIEWIDELESLIRNQHKSISKYFCSNKGIELQWLDGMLIREVCYHFSQKGICVLPIHDSIIIQEQYSNEAKQVMMEKFALKFNGYKCPVKIKTYENNK